MTTTKTGREINVAINPYEGTSEHKIVVAFYNESEKLSDPSELEDIYCIDDETSEIVMEFHGFSTVYREGNNCWVLSNDGSIYDGNPNAPFQDGLYGMAIDIEEDNKNDFFDGRISQLEEQNKLLMMQNEMLTEVILEMSSILYA